MASLPLPDESYYEEIELLNARLGLILSTLGSSVLHPQSCDLINKRVLNSIVLIITLITISLVYKSYIKSKNIIS